MAVKGHMRAAGEKIVPYTGTPEYSCLDPGEEKHTDDESRLDKTYPVINSYTVNPELVSES
jgi:hypothetical protein